MCQALDKHTHFYDWFSLMLYQWHILSRAASSKYEVNFRHRKNTSLFDLLRHLVLLLIPFYLQSITFCSMHARYFRWKCVLDDVTIVVINAPSYYRISCGLNMNLIFLMYYLLAYCSMYPIINCDILVRVWHLSVDNVFVYWFSPKHFTFYICLGL